MNLEELNPAEAPRDVVEKAIVEWRAAREERLAADKIATKLKSKESALMGFVLEAFKEQEFEGMLIGGRVTGLSKQPQAVVTDRHAYLEYMLQTGATELLQFRPSTAAIDERTEAGIEVPGTEYIDTFSLFDRKA